MSSSSALKSINQSAEVISRDHSLIMNINAAKSLANVLSPSLGPRGSMKMLVSGAGLIKVTKDGKVLLDEMQLSHPTAAVIARTATAQDDVTGDGTTSNVLFTGELLSQCSRYLSEGLHPRVLVDGFEAAREETLRFLEEYKLSFSPSDITRELLTQVARTALRTKVDCALADHLTEIVVNAVQTIRSQNEEIDLHMVEIMTMKHQSSLDTRFIDGLVLDHGGRHPEMAKKMENPRILNLNVSLEYEKSEVNSSFFYKTAEDRAALVKAERKYTDDKVMKIIRFKEETERTEGKPMNLLIINQKGIDPISLDLLQKAGIVGLRRAKRRNMERLVKACGGFAVNSVENLDPSCLGTAKLMYEHSLGDDNFTFIEGCPNPTSCSILIKGANDHTIRQIQDAVHDGLRAVTNTIEDRSLIPGAGEFECAAHLHLHQNFKSKVLGRAKIGVAAFADALLIIPKTLAVNSGLDATAAIIELLEETQKGNHVGLDIETGHPIVPGKNGIWDNTRVKKQFLHLGSLIAIKLLLVDEVMRAGRKMGKQ